MNFDLDQATIKLTKDGVIPLRHAVGSTVAVLRGAVWLTQEGDRQDYELHAGESLVIRTGGLTVLSALEDAALSILVPCYDRAGLAHTHTPSSL